LNDDLAARMRGLSRAFLLVLALTIGAGVYEKTRYDRYTPAKGTVVGIHRDHLGAKLQIKLDSGQDVSAWISDRDRYSWRGQVGKPISVLQDDQVATRVHVPGVYHNFKLTLCLTFLCLILLVVNVSLRVRLASSG